jgi:hypothetical protein
LSELILRAQSGESDVQLSRELIDLLDFPNEEPEIYAAVGDSENTIAALQYAHQRGTGFRSLLSMRINPSYDFIRGDPRFITLLQQVGLSD